MDCCRVLPYFDDIELIPIHPANFSFIEMMVVITSFFAKD